MPTQQQLAKAAQQKFFKKNNPHLKLPASSETSTPTTTSLSKKEDTGHRGPTPFNFQQFRALLTAVPVFSNEFKQMHKKSYIKEINGLTDKLYDLIQNKKKEQKTKKSSIERELSRTPMHTPGYEKLQTEREKLQTLKYFTNKSEQEIKQIIRDALIDIKTSLEDDQHRLNQSTKDFLNACNKAFQPS